MTAHPARAIVYCSLGIIAALYVVGFVSYGIIRHMVQTAPQWVVLALAARGSRWTKWVATPCAVVWLFLMGLIWLFLLGWAHVISGTFSPVEIAMTIVVGACSIVIIAYGVRMRSGMSATSGVAILLLSLVLQLVVLRVSFLRSVERDPWAPPRRQIGATKSGSLLAMRGDERCMVLSGVHGCSTMNERKIMLVSPCSVVNTGDAGSAYTAPNI